MATAIPFPSGTLIEACRKSIPSDAGESMACRRRDLLLLLSLLLGFSLALGLVSTAQSFFHLPGHYSTVTFSNLVAGDPFSILPSFILIRRIQWPTRNSPSAYRMIYLPVKRDRLWKPHPNLDTSGLETPADQQNYQIASVYLVVKLVAKGLYRFQNGLDLLGVFFLSDMDSFLRIVKEYLSFPAVVCSPSSAVSSLSEPSKAPAGSDQSPGQPRSSMLPRMVSKEPKPRSEASSSVEYELTRSSSSRAMEETASVNLIACKLHRRKTAIPWSPPPRRQSHLTAVVGEEKLGFPLLGLLNFGQCSFFLWPISLGVSPHSSHRPRSVKSFKLTFPLLYLHLNKSSSSRGLFSILVLEWIQGLVGYYRKGGRSCSVVCPLETVSELEYKFEDFYIVDLRVHYLYQTLLLFKSPSTPLSSPDLSNSLLERGFCLLESIPKKSFNFLTASLSYIMVYTGPEDATVLMLMSPEVVESSKSHYAGNALTNPQLAIVLVWRFGFLMKFKPSNILVDTLSNFYKFVYLSSYAFSLFASDLAIWLANRVMSGLAYLCVTF